MRFGVNYTPSGSWFHSWLDFSAAQVSRDFDAIASLGLDHVRIFPLWPVLQPNRALIRHAAIADVVTVVELAAQRGLEVSVDVLNGHLSSYDFVPAWLVSWHARNMFTDPDVVAACGQLARQLGAALADHPNVTGLTLGNEFVQFAAPRHPLAAALTPSQAEAWTAQLLADCQAALPNRRHVHSFDDDLWFVDSHPFTPAHAVSLGAATTVHSWIFAHVGPHLGGEHPALGWFARYLVELAIAWSPDPQRPVWLQEVGAPTTTLPPHAVGPFVEQTFRSVTEVPQVEAITWWCSHDVSRRLADFPELEYTLGLFDERGQVKPIGRQVAQLVKEHRATPGAARAPQQRPALVLAAERDGSNRAVAHPTGEFFARWAELAVAGTPPAIVLADQVAAPQLAARELHLL